MERVDFCEIISYENMVEYPEKWLTRILHRCIGELNDDGVDLSVVDFVVDQSKVKDFRETRPTLYNDSVGFAKTVFNTSQLDFIHSKLP